MKTVTIFISLLLACISISGQNKWDAGILLSPSISQIDRESFTKYYDEIFPFNEGIRVNYQYHKFYFSSGLLHLTFGEKWSDEISTTDQPEGGLAYYTQKIKIRGYFLPLNVNYIVVDKKKIQLYAGVGLYTGYIYSQKFYPGFREPIPMKIVDTLYVGVNAGLGIKYRLSNRFSILFNPNFLYQLRKEIPHEDMLAYTPRLWLVSFDLGIYYQFGKKE